MSLLAKMILSCTALFAAFGIAWAQGKKEQKPTAAPSNTASGREIFKRYCASCHGVDAKGNGPAAISMKTLPPDLTILTKRHEGTYPEGYVGAVLKFGRNFASHGSEDMPVWGSRFRTLDPVNDPTGQQHVNDVVTYIGSLQVK